AKVSAFLGDDTSPFASRGRLDFGNVKRGRPTTDYIRITNDTNRTVKFKKPKIEGENAFKVANYCGATLAAASFCNIFVTFNTNLNVGGYNGRISIDATGMDDLVFELSGSIVP
ncbi:MAG: hypothetical protein J7501_10380, partial [Bdellovibrio sp.]|nr:hypothetical protein [Bdellovibrio sp.]